MGLIAFVVAQASSGAVDTLAPYAQIGGQGVIVAVLAIIGRRMAEGLLVPRNIADRERQYEQLTQQAAQMNDSIGKLLESSSKREDQLTDALRESHLLAGRLSVHIEKLDSRLASSEERQR